MDMIRVLLLINWGNEYFVPQQPTLPDSKAANSKRVKKKNSNSSNTAVAANGGEKAAEGYGANLATASSTPHKVITK